MPKISGHPILTFLIPWLGLAVLGCGGGPSNLDTAGPRPSHGGNMMELPGSAGLVELAFERSDAGTKGAKAKGKIVAYFTGKGGTGNPATEPSDVVFTDDTGKTYPLAPKAGGAGDGSRFESAEASIPAASELTGQISGKIGPQSFTLVNRPR